MPFSGLTFLMATLVTGLSCAVVPASVPYVTAATVGVSAVMPCDGQGGETSG